MKRFLLLQIAAVVVSMTAAGQTAEKVLVEEGRVWSVASIRPSEKPAQGSTEGFYQDLKGGWGSATIYRLSLQGDTLMGSQAYKKLMQEGLGFVCGLRQEGQKVYERYWEDVPETLAFDFGLSVGDVFENDEIGGVMHVEQVDTIVINGVSRRRFVMCVGKDDAEAPQSLVDVWVEGVGCVGGPLRPFWWCAIGNQQMTQSCYQQDRLLLTADDFRRDSQLLRVSTAKAQEKSPATYDLQGRRQSPTRRHGLYIRDGQKYAR